MRLQERHPSIWLNVAEAQGAELDAMLDTATVELAVLFRFSKPTGTDERQLCLAGTHLVSAPGDALTHASTLNFSRLQGLHLVLPRRPSHWRDAPDDRARSLGFRLDAVAGADSLAVELDSGRVRPSARTQAA